ncbi:hypothetical protein Tco_0147265, partial [Tanacetum coccineum]
MSRKQINLGKTIRLLETHAPRYHIRGGADAYTRPETASKTSRDPPPSEVNTSRRGEESMEYHDDLTDFVPSTTHDSPLLGEEAKTAQDRVINRLKLRVKRLEKKRKARTPQPMKKRLFKGRVKTFTDISLGEDASKQGRSSDKTKSMFKDIDFDVLDAEQITTSGPSHVSTADQVSTARPAVSAATPYTPHTTITIFDDEDVTMAMAQ